MTPPELIVSAAIRATRAVDDLTLRAATIDDGSHRPYGVEGVEVVGDYTIRVWHAPLTFIGDAQVTADETVAKVRVVPGASAGLDYVDLTLWRDGAKVPVSTIAVPYANLWLTVHGYTS